MAVDRNICIQMKQKEPTKTFNGDFKLKKTFVPHALYKNISAL